MDQFDKVRELDRWNILMTIYLQADKITIPDANEKPYEPFSYIVDKSVKHKEPEEMDRQASRSVNLFFCRNFNVCEDWKYSHIVASNEQRAKYPDFC